MKCELTEEHVDEDFAEAVEDDAEENGTAADGLAEGEADAGVHDRGAEDEDPAIDEDGDKEPSTRGSCDMVCEYK